MCDRAVKKVVTFHSARDSQKVTNRVLLCKTKMTLYWLSDNISYLQYKIFFRVVECCSERLFSLAIMVTLEQLLQMKRTMNNYFCVPLVIDCLCCFINYFLFKSLI